MTVFFGVLWGLIILVLLVVVHELGHAIAARRNNVVVEEFGIGFPPRALKKKLKNGVLFTLNWIPLGGFVKLQGEYDASNKKGDYGAATFWQKTKILLAGITVNWLVAAILLTGLAFVGLPKVISNQFSIPSDTTETVQSVELTSVSSGYPAAKAGLKSGDKIIRFANEEVPTVERLIEISKKYKGQKITVIYNRDGTEASTQVDLRDADTAIFGASLGQREFIQATWSAPIVGVVTAVQFTGLTFQGIGELFANLFSGIVMKFSSDVSVQQQADSNLQSVSDSVSGPIGILGTIFPAAEQAGPTQLIFLTAIISISLAVMNILPIPALDGGRWFTMAIFKLLKKKLTKSREDKIQTIGFLILMLLIIMVTIADVAKII